MGLLSSTIKEYDILARMTRSMPAIAMRVVRLHCATAVPICTASALRRLLRIAAALPLRLAPPLQTARAAPIPRLERRSSAATASAMATAVASPWPTHQAPGGLPLRGVRRWPFEGSSPCHANSLPATPGPLAAIGGSALGTAAEVRLGRGTKASGGAETAGCGPRGLFRPARRAFAASADGMVLAVSAARWCVTADDTGPNVGAD